MGFVKRRQKMKYRVIDYFDVWGNEEDGWEVNDQRDTGVVLNIADDATDEDILNMMLMHNLLATTENVRINWTDIESGVLYVDSTDYPLYLLEAKVEWE
jgi:hypothetical protein